MQTFSLEIRKYFFPNEFEKEVTDAELVKLERDLGEDDGQGTGEDGRDMRNITFAKDARPEDRY